MELLLGQLFSELENNLELLTFQGDWFQAEQPWAGSGVVCVGGLLAPSTTEWQDLFLVKEIPFNLQSCCWFQVTYTCVWCTSPQVYVTLPHRTGQQACYSPKLRNTLGSICNPIYVDYKLFWKVFLLVSFFVCFYPRDAMLARVIAIATCSSVRPSVCLSRAGIVSKRRKLAAWFLHHLVAPRL